MYNVLHKRIHSNYIECPAQKNTFYCVSPTPKYRLLRIIR